MPWSGFIAVHFWLNDKHHKTEQHPSLNMSIPCLCARVSLATHQGRPCPIVLIERSLPSWSECDTIVGNGLGLSYVPCRALAFFWLSSQSERGQQCAVVWFHR